MSELAEKESHIQHEVPLNQLFPKHLIWLLFVLQLKRYKIYVSALKWKLSQINLFTNLNTTQMLTVSSAPPLQSVAIGEETGDETTDTPVIIPVKKTYSTDR